jgi:DNA (cytosine-5)-methyltransferase 1
VNKVQTQLLEDEQASSQHFSTQRVQKIDRIKHGGMPRVLDLFAGCGGLSLGFKTAGFDIAGAIEIDPIAARTHALNFHKKTRAKQDLYAQAYDITITEPEQLIAEQQIGADVAACIDAIVGGPPCQAFARVGRAKLREVADHPEAFLQDARGNLYLRYLHYVRKLQPLIILMENVPDVVNYGGHNIPHEMCEVLSAMGYTCRYTLLNTAFYGVPQMRERMFLLAYAKELETDIVFPSPTHWLALPRGYQGSRQVALKVLTYSLFDPGFYLTPPEISPTLPPAVTAREAIGDLPRITQHLDGNLTRGARRFDQQIPYPDNVPVSPYAQYMRNWPGFENLDGISDHVIRSLPRDYDIFRRMNPGDQYPQAYEHAVQLFHEKLEQLASQGAPVAYNSPEYEKLRQKIVPPYDPGKFPNKWRKMEADCPARTLMAHLGKDGYSHIHYDSSQARTISVREAARLQSFPDGFIFEGTMNPAFRQIGNAVPPLMALAFATTILQQIQGAIACHKS